MLKKLNRSMKAERQRTLAYKLSKQISEFYATNAVSPWQKERVSDIRKLFQEKEHDLAVAHDHAVSRLSEQFMEFELDYLRASQQFKVTNPGEEMEFKAKGGFFSRVFMTNLIKKAKEIGFNYGGKKETI